jgi:hypothetical protein
LGASVGSGTTLLRGVCPVSLRKSPPQLTPCTTPSPQHHGDNSTSASQPVRYTCAENPGYLSLTPLPHIWKQNKLLGALP